MPDKIKTNPDLLFEKRNDVLDILYRLKGQFGALVYLMGGESGILKYPKNDLAMLFLDARERLEVAIDICGAMKI